MTTTHYRAMYATVTAARPAGPCPESPAACGGAFAVAAPFHDA